MATAEETGLSLSEWVGLISAGLTALAILIGLIGAHFHSAVRNPEARAKLIERLTKTGARDSYHERLAGMLTWLDEKIGPPPFVRHNPRGWPVFALPSLAACVAASLAYSVGAFLAGWIGGGPSKLGQVTVMEATWTPGWAPVWAPNLLITLLFLGIFGLFWWFVRVMWAGPPSHSDVFAAALVWTAWVVFFFFFISSVFYIVADVADALAGASAYVAVWAVAIAGVMSGAIPIAASNYGAGHFGGGVLAGVLCAMGANSSALVLFGNASISKEETLIALLFLLALPYLNGLLDWISLSVSRWFGRWIVAERDSPKSLLWTLGLALADLLAAVGFAFMVAWLLALGVEGTALRFDLSLELESYVEGAAAAPWTTGFWATFMVLSTLFPTAVHFVLALGAMLMAWSGNPLRAWAARKLASGNEADWLGPQLYLIFGWLVPTLLVPAALIWLIAQIVGLIEPLPDALRDTALHGIATAQIWLR